MTVDTLISSDANTNDYPGVCAGTAAGGVTLDAGTCTVGQTFDAGGLFQAYEAFLTFDTTGVVAPSTAELHVHVSVAHADNGQQSYYNTAAISVAFLTWPPSPVSTGDWADTAGLAAEGSEISDTISGAGVFDNTDLIFTLDAGDINPSGLTRWMMFTDRQASATSPDVGGGDAEEFWVIDSASLVVDGGVVTPPSTGLQVRTVTMDGTEIDVIPFASVGDVERTLNIPDAASWSFPKHAYTEAQIPVLGTDSQPVEVQIWTIVDGERDVLLFWGPTVDIQGSGADGAIHCTGAGVDWYLIRRYLDGQRTNLLDNPSFETGTISSWTEGGPVTATVTDDGKILGTKAVRLEASAPFGDAHLHQPLDVTATGVGTLLTVAAWYQIETFTAPAYAARGLYVEGIEASVVRAKSNVKIDFDTPTNLWRRAETTIFIPPGETWEIDVRLYAVDGSILWDAVELVAMQSVSTAGLVGTVAGEADLTRIVRQHVLHLQDAAVDKSDVNITTDPDRALIGVTMAKHIQWADHIAWDAQLREFIERGDGIDYAILYDPDAGTRDFYVFHPRRGVDRSGNTSLEFPGNIADYRWHRDGSATVTTATWLGDGDGPDREEGYYSDASFIGGLTLEDVKQAPTGSAIASLEPLAEGEVTLLNNPPRVIEVDIRPDATFIGGDFDGVPLLNGLDPGDWTPLTIDDGYVQESGGSWRIVKLVFHGDTRVLTATLNEDLG